MFGAIDTFMTATYPDIVVMYENGPEIDDESVGSIFMDVSIRFYSANPAEVGPHARTRHTGAIAVDVYAKQATGTALAGQLLQGISHTLRRKRLGPGLTRATQRTVPDTIKGWYKSGTLTPFTADEI